MDCDRCFLEVPFAMPTAVTLSQWMGVGDWGYPSSAKVSCMMRNSFTLRKSAPSLASASAADNSTELRMVHSV